MGREAERKKKRDHKAAIPNCIERGYYPAKSKGGNTPTWYASSITQAAEK